ncbi:DNA repair protein RecO [Novosphingobium sp. PP1Y]|uniref:DNA repair protein RecO n=1 Tax=Novosphingobium sp. PP1Y TaxID=702113 RepID=UPI00020EED62|nr:recombination protein O N-terminal domain-containing protein [Novosphingobium sp. PP1Y]CCA92890.1 DNA repair protein RecO (recombination protein O) [Novosphingobium sp. PP1Y]
MQLRAPAIVCSTRPHGETAVIARLLTQESGIVAAYVAGGRGRNLRPVVIPGNVVDAEIRARSESQLPYARLELVESRGPWLTEPLPSAAISWVTALTAIALPERHPYPALYDALEALLDAICVAPSARGWALPLLSFEVLLLRELGYGVPVPRPQDEDWVAVLDTFDRLGRELARYPLADRRRDVMAARDLLRERLARI